MDGAGPTATIPALARLQRCSLQSRRPLDKSLAPRCRTHADGREFQIRRESRAIVDAKRVPGQVPPFQCELGNDGTGGQQRQGAE